MHWSNGLRTILLAGIIAIAGCAEEGAETPDGIDTTGGDADGNVTDDATDVAAPTATLGADVDEGTAPLAVNFTIDGSGDNATWSLDFGDGEGAEGVGLPGAANHTYAAGDFVATLTVTAGGNSTTSTRNITAVEAAEEPRELPDRLEFSYGESAGCTGDFLQAAGADCVSALGGPSASGIDGFWEELDERYWGLHVSTTVDNVLGDSDCYFTDADMNVLAEANNGGGPCIGVVPEGTAWVFLYSYAEPALGQTMTFSV